MSGGKMSGVKCRITVSKGSRLEALRMPFCLGAALIVRTSSLQIFVSGSHIWLAYPAMGFMRASNNENRLRGDNAILLINLFS